MASPSFTNSDQEDGDSQGNFPSAFDFRALSTSPAMSTSSFGAGLASNTLSAALASVSSASAAAARQQQRSPAAGGSGASKRYRTHLTPVQVYVSHSENTSVYSFRMFLGDEVVVQRLQDSVDERMRVAGC